MRYIVAMPIISATGIRFYEVEADSPDEAKAKVATGDVRCTDEDIEAETDDNPDSWTVETRE